MEENFTTIVHDNYNQVTKQNDIALIKLNYNAKTNQRNIKPIRLPLDNESLPDKVEVAGWGFTERRRQPEVLMKGLLDVTEYEKCHEFYKGGVYAKLTLTKNQFCGKGKHEVMEDQTIQTCK